MSRSATSMSCLHPLREGGRRSRAFFAAMIVTGAMGIGPHAKAKPPPAGCDVPDVVAQVLPAIVNIQNAGLAHQEIMNVRNDLLAPQSNIPPIAYSVGTGFIISSVA